MDDLQINLIDFIFLNLAFVAIFTGFIINNYERYVPAFIIKSYRYGSFAYQGTEASYVQAVEVPKEYFKHFYLFSSFFSISMLTYMLAVYFFNVTVSLPIHIVFKVLLQANEPSVSVTAALIAMSLLTLQCTRRLYETFCLQVFAKSSKMNISHYIAAYIHYFLIVVTISGQAPVFSGHQNREAIIWNDTYTSLLAIPCIIIFLASCYEQLRTNMILANLRKDKKSGLVVTDEHKIPHGRLFEYISSPHRLTEMILYTVLLLLVPTRTFFCIYVWVIGNQIQSAIHNHEWYKKTFNKYPTNRYAVIPYLL